MTNKQQSSRAFAGGTFTFTAWPAGDCPEKRRAAALAEAHACFGPRAAYRVLDDADSLAPDSSITVVVTMNSRSPRVDDRPRVRTIRVTGYSVLGMQRRALARVRETLYGPTRALRVVERRVEKAPEDSYGHPLLGEFDIEVLPRSAGYTRCVLTLVESVTGNSIDEMAHKAWHAGHQFFAPGAEFRVVFHDVCTTPERLGTEDRFFARFVEIERILSGPPEFYDQPYMSFNVQGVTGNSLSRIRRRVLHEAAQFFGSDADKYRVVFPEDGVETTPSSVATKDRYLARDVVVEVILKDPAQVYPSPGYRVLTLEDPIWGKSRKELEDKALQEARKRLAGRVRPDAELQVEFRDGRVGSMSGEKDAPGRYFAHSVDVYEVDVRRGRSAA